MGYVLTEEQETYLKNHLYAVLATGRADGSPQVSQIVYDWDGTDIVISAKSYTAKWKNALRQPKVALLVHDGRQQLIVYGTAECIDQDPLRAELTIRLYRTFKQKPEMQIDSDFIARLDREERTVLRITPEKVFMND